MTGALLPDIGVAPGSALAALVDAVLAAWPEHAKFLRQSFAGREAGVMDVSETVADLIEAVAAAAGRPLAAYAADYRFLCEEIVFPEELFFRREGRYRLSTFAEAEREVYANAPLMARYMNGLIVSDALWRNHACAMADFALHYLAGPGGEGRHLEIGPGHGLLLHLALRHGRHSRIHAWDVSRTSIIHTGHVLEVLGQHRAVTLAIRNIYDREAVDAAAGCYDSVILSEVVEHLEDPLGALQSVRRLLAEGGRLWANAPANGPAPDHLFLFRHPDELADLIRRAGFEIVRTADHPVTGATLERVIRQELPISCCVEAVAA
ncbi:MAG: methyltransferase domain-containing protein [Sphingomonadaceae bacterium]